MITPLQFQKRLLAWFDQHGRKHLPWQQNKTPYRVWISEIMLQQTQVATVIPYYHRFMQTFPDLVTLANASQDDVLHLWTGLGYYSRARNLHQAAKIVVEKYGGGFPESVSDLMTLPGIGESTAGAIIAIAFNHRAAILDGNVKRVLTRFHGIESAIQNKQTIEQLWLLAKKYTPLKRVSDYTQAMMDLGATLCTRKKPVCSACPLVSDCIAYKKDLVDILPKKNATKTLPIKTATFIIFKNKNSILLQKRPAKGIWGSLWSVPEIEGIANQKAIRDFCAKQFDLSLMDYDILNTFRHTFTHYHLDIHPIVINLSNYMSRKMTKTQQIWYNPQKPEAIGLPKPVLTLIRGLE